MIKIYSQYEGFIIERGGTTSSYKLGARVEESLTSGRINIYDSISNEIILPSVYWKDIYDEKGLNIGATAKDTVLKLSGIVHSPLSKQIEVRPNTNDKKVVESLNNIERLLTRMSELLKEILN